MAYSKGFSLIETLVAITIASIATLALMRVISHASHTSAEVINHFDSSIMMGLVATEVSDALQGKVMNVDDLLGTRYTIDHPVIRKSLKSTAYEIQLSQKEVLNPPMNVMDFTTSTGTIAIQKVLLQNAQEKTAFFRLTDGIQ
ncbi:MAG: type II secretion system protein [Sulfuricurvum sp.]|jgi:prepilin-type N-terminal cleavage/methylation domain-containing protein